MYVKVENGIVVQAGLPETGYLKTGESVSGFNLLPDEVLKEEGWLPLEMGIAPEGNYTTHYDIQEDKVIANYTVEG